MKLNLSSRKIRSLFRGILILSVCGNVTGTDLDEAFLLEKNGDLTGARVLYLQWLDTAVNRNQPDYGRTLLHVLRMGGDKTDLLNTLDSYLPGVQNTQDRKEILKFAAFLSDLSGMEERAAGYFILLEGEDGQAQVWKKDEYYSLLNGGQSPQGDPLAGESAYHKESDFKNISILYLLHLNSVSDDSGKLKEWQEKMDSRYPFLREYPDWLFLNWYCSRGRNINEQAELYSSLIKKDFPGSLEAGLIDGTIHLYPSPFYLLYTAENNAVHAEDDEGDAYSEDTPDLSVTPYYLQAGAFGSRSNAEELRQEIYAKSSLNAEIIQSENIYKVIIRSDNPDRDAGVLQAGGFDVFRTLPPDSNH